MKNIIILFIAAFFTIGCKNETARTETPYLSADLAITNVTLIDGTGAEAQKNATILIKDGRIMSISGTDGSAEADSIIDGKGKYLIPGLFDAHFHFPYERERALKQLIHFGVTSIFNTGSSHTSYDMIKEFIRLEKADSIVAPNIYYTSYYVTIPGAHPVKDIDNETGIITGNITISEDKNIYLLKSEDEIPAIVRDAKEGGAYGMKITIEDGPVPPLVDRIPQKYINRLVKEAKKENLKVFAHISDTIELDMGIKAEVDAFVHSITTKHLWGESNKELVEQMVADSIPMVTTNMLLKSSLYPFNPQWRQTSEWQVYQEDQIAEIEDFEPVFKKSVEPMLKYYMGFSDFKIDELKAIMENFRWLNDKGVSIVIGTDVGALAYILPGHSLHEELQLLQLSGMKAVDIIRCATLNSAKMIDVDKEYGSIEEGKVADMVLLDKNPLEDISNTLSINTVFKRGKAQPRINPKNKNL